MATLETDIAAYQERLEKVYDWRQTQAMTLGAACFSLSGLVLSPLIPAMFDAQAHVRLWQVFLLLSSSLLATVAGGIWHRRARRLHTSFLGSDPSIVSW